jgi:hypothetical protein
MSPRIAGALTQLTRPSAEPKLLMLRFGNPALVERIVALVIGQIVEGSG